MELRRVRYGSMGSSADRSRGVTPALGAGGGWFDTSIRHWYLILLVAACDLPSEPPLDAESCVFAKQAVWIAAGYQLPVPDSLAQSNRWELPAPWYQGDETTTFEATSRGCLVVNR